MVYYRSEHSAILMILSVLVSFSYIFCLNDSYINFRGDLFRLKVLSFLSELGMVKNGFKCG